MTKVAPLFDHSVDNFRVQQQTPKDVDLEWETIDLNDEETLDESCPQKYTYTNDHTLSSEKGSHDGHGDGPQDKTKKVTKRKICTTFIQRHWCSMAFFLLGPLILAISGGIITSVCQKLRDEHSSKVPALCFITNIEEVNYTATCQCGECEGRGSWTCYSHYPCYTVQVDYRPTAPHHAGSGKIAGQNISTPCSIDLQAPCYTKDFVNRKLVEEEVAWFNGQSSGVDCVLDLNDKGLLLLRKHYKIWTNAAISRCYFWPIMLILLAMGWFSFVIFDIVATFRKKPGASREGSEESLYRGMYLALQRFNKNLTLWERIRYFIRNQFMEKEQFIRKERMEFIESMRKRSLPQIVGTKSRPKLDTYLGTPSHLMTTIEKGTIDKDAEGTGRKLEIENLRKFFMMDHVSLTDSESDGTDNDKQMETQSLN